MNFSIGTMGIGIVGESTVARKTREILTLCANSSINPNLVFDFTESLPVDATAPYAKIDNYVIRPDHLRITEKLFTFDIALEENPVRVAVSLRKTSAWKQWTLEVRKNWRHFHTHGQGAYIHYLKRFVFYIYMPWVQLMLLQKGCTFCHSSAIVRDGKGILFPAWGGVGKTGIMSLYLEQGWQFLSDDFCVIDRQGGMHLHPMPMHIYKYHQLQCESLAQRMLAGSTRRDRWLWNLCSLWKPPDRLVRWISPDKVFGADKLAHRADLHTIVMMQRQGDCKQINISPCDAGEAAHRLTNILLEEINNLVEISILTNSCLAMTKIPNLSDLYQSIYGIYHSAFGGKPCYRMSIPQAASMKDIHTALEQNRLF